MNQMTEDVYNLTVNDAYIIPENNFSIVTQEEYSKICYEQISSMRNEFEATSCIKEYSDIGSVEWDKLSTGSQNYLYGRFSSIFYDVYVACSTAYSAEGAITT